MGMCGREVGRRWGGRRWGGGRRREAGRKSLISSATHGGRSQPPAVPLTARLPADHDAGRRPLGEVDTLGLEARDVANLQQQPAGEGWVRWVGGQGRASVGWLGVGGQGRAPVGWLGWVGGLGWVSWLAGWRGGCAWSGVHGPAAAPLLAGEAGGRARCCQAPPGGRQLWGGSPAGGPTGRAPRRGRG